MRRLVPRVLHRLGALALGTMLGCAAAPLPAPPSSPSALLGAPLPAFQRRTLAGTAFDTAALGGRLLVVDFFASYCRPCQRTLPALERLHVERPDVAIVGVSLDDDAERAATMVTRHRLTFPVVHDSGHALAGRFRVVDLPTAFIADDKGRIIWSAAPGAPEDALPRAVAAFAGAR
jgi:cytochrome c biogenesis protein CcmG/thiol:disulfide interchange protein DsbE